VIPKIPEDVREYMLQSLLPCVDLLLEEGVVVKTLLAEIETNVQLLETLRQHSSGQDIFMVLAATTSLTGNVMALYEATLELYVATGHHLPPSEVHLEALKEIMNDENNQDQGH